MFKLLCICFCFVYLFIYVISFLFGMRCRFVGALNDRTASKWHIIFYFITLVQKSIHEKMASWVCSRLHCRNTACISGGEFPRKVFSASKHKGFRPIPKPHRRLVRSYSSTDNDQLVTTSPTLVATEYADLNLSLSLPSVTLSFFSVLSLYQILCWSE